MKKIAILIFDITKKAGTERAVCNLAGILSESKKYSVSIISVYSISGEAAYDIKEGVNIYHLGLSCATNMVAKLSMYKSLIAALKKISDQKKIDIVIGTKFGLNVMLFFLRKKIKTIVCEHFNYMSLKIHLRAIRKLLYPFLNSVVVLTRSDAKHYQFHKNVKIIQNSLSFFPEKQSELTNKRILAIGRLTPQKGFDLLIKAIFIIRNQCDDWEVKIIGSGEDEGELRSQIEYLQLGNIVKICPPTNAIIQEYLDASIFVLSSRYEGLPMVMIEAKTSGLPIVSFDCPEGPADVVHHNEDGLLVENGNVEELSKALLELMHNKEKRIQFGKKALENITQYEPKNVFTLWDNLLGGL